MEESLYAKIAKLSFLGGVVCLVLSLLAVSCAVPQTAQQPTRPKSDVRVEGVRGETVYFDILNGVLVTRLRDDKYGVICYITENGVDCLPLSDTAWGQ